MWMFKQNDDRKKSFPQIGSLEFRFLLVLCKAHMEYFELEHTVGGAKRGMWFPARVDRLFQSLAEHLGLDPDDSTKLFVVKRASENLQAHGLIEFRECDREYFEYTIHP